MTELELKMDKKFQEMLFESRKNKAIYSLILAYISSHPMTWNEIIINMPNLVKDANTAYSRFYNCTKQSGN